MNAVRLCAKAHKPGGLCHANNRPPLVQLLTIALFVALHVHDLYGDPQDTSSAMPFGRFALAMVGMVVVLSGAFHGVAWVCGRRMDRRGEFGAVAFADRFMLSVRVVGVGLLVYALLELGWLRAVRLALGDWVLLDEFVAISPALALFVLNWWSMEPVERRVREALLWRELHEGAPVHPPLSRCASVWHHTRHSLLLMLVPLSAIWSWEELVVFGSQWLGLVRGNRAVAWWGNWGADAARWIGVLLIFLLTPAVLRLVWSTVRISEGDMRDQALAVAAKYRVRVIGPLLWRTHGSVVNAAILGLFYPLRYMLFTDALLERLSREEVEGVIAHEIAHVKLRHMIWLALSILASSILLGWVLTAVDAARVVPTWVIETWGAGASLAATLLVFGWVSRRFEWQADAFAVRHMSGDAEVVTAQAVTTMQQALRQVAVLNGIPIRRFTFRHGSIAERQQRLGSLTGAPVHCLPIDSQVWWVKMGALAVLGLTAAVYAVFAVTALVA
ncbi:hypothetical protein PHYC_03068 [Phycisphaerales bacterium]|nr:hypothetical protein PHYC_03068 [Phycisphaerales bacterium]